MKFFSQVVTVAAMAVFTEAATQVNMCKAPNKVDCIPVEVGFTQCVNLDSKGTASSNRSYPCLSVNKYCVPCTDGRPYVSGFTGPGGNCDIYSKAGCAGTANSLDEKGWDNFPFPVVSIDC